MAEQRLGLSEDALDRRQHIARNPGKRDGTRVAIEKTCADDVLDLLNLCAQSRLRRVQCLRRFGETAVVRDRRERAQLRNVRRMVLVPHIR